MLNGLDLFSGIGGITLALSEWVRPVAYCENDRYAQGVLLSRMSDGHLPRAPIWDDVRTLRASDIQHSIDIIYGGFPCQDISCAGTGAGLEGKRSGLFFEILRLTEEVRPSFIFLENVPAVRTRGLNRICFELARLGYDLRWTTVSAAEVGACHIRKRWFLLAHSHSVRLREECRSKVRRYYPFGQRSLEPDSQGETRRTSWASERLTQPAVDRTGDGIPYRVDRHHGLGNAVVPAQARVAFQRLAGLRD